MSHTEINSKEDFDNAVSQKGKYVFVLAYDGTAPADADSYALKFADMVSSYKFDVSKAPQAKVSQHVLKPDDPSSKAGSQCEIVQALHGIEETPCALVYKDGQRVAKADGMKPPSMQEIGQMISGGK
ncbi:hypothetical protein D0864_03725 [Hortaea werneckii]|uniref:Thioredoxin domain-containing protein n=1 Tax=Hortaea werneckii TaxID=91943 RepID=A0A3M7GHD9_HORWE|nr:hypothetical protein D0863_06302 [Hortaea werneckii]RMZ00484.1 hypothetical protein D0864_03725 [Hortaea werneckii]RMZ09928.1 hypothetical protein D0862_03460 [Hortaea werneckii]